MGQSSSVPGRRSRRATSSNATSTIPAPSEPLNPDRPAVIPDDINAIGTGAGIQPKNEAVEICNTTTQQDMLHSNGEQIEPNNHYHLSSSDRQLHQHTSDRPQRTSTSSPSHLIAPSSDPAASIASPSINTSSITPTRPLASALQPASEACASSSSTSTRSRSFLSRLRSRRLSRRTSSSNTVSQMPEDSALEIAIPSTSKITLEDTIKSQEPAEGAIVPLQMPMTPPEELDAMFEERQRARRMIEATLMSAGSDMDRPLPSARSARSSDPSTVPIPYRPVASSTASSHLSLDEERSLYLSSNPLAASPSRPSFPILPNPTMEQAVYTQSNAPPGDLTHSPDRVYAVLPRRSRSSSPTSSTRFPSTTSAEPSARPIAPSAITSTAQNAPSSPSAIPAVPRHVLVQGLVTRAPSRRNQLEPRSRVSSTTSQASQESEVIATNDSGFWDELPGSDAMDVDNAEPDRDSEDEDWERAMSQLLNIRRDSPAAERPSAIDSSDPEDDGIDGQANLIGRLLRIAAAATAATLLPGGLTVDGEVVPGFDDSGPLRALVGRGRSPSGQQPSRANSNNESISTSTNSDNGNAQVRSDNGATLAVESMNGNSATPAETFNEVVASASVSAPEASVPASEAAVASESALPSSPPVPALTSLPSEAPSSSPFDLAAPLGSPAEPSSIAMDLSPPPTPTTTLERTPNSMLASPYGIASPALSGPENGLRAGNSLLPGILPLRASSGRLAPQGTFDRFLADLQRDVSSAIRSSVDRESSTTSVQNPAEPAAPAIVTDTTSNNASYTPETNASTPEAQAARPFSFFRAYRFPPRSMPAAAAGGVPLIPSTSVNAASPAPTGVTPAAEAAGNAEDMQIDQRAPQSATPAVTTAAVPNIVPMIFVGVRQAPASMLENLPGSFGMAPSGARPDPPASDTATVDVPSDIDMPDASAPTSAPDNTSERQEPAASNAPGVHGFVLWIFGGLYPPTHPVVLAPSILGDESMSYEEMMRLADMIGQHKPPTVSKQEIEKAGLKTIKGDQVRTAEVEGNVRSITADRCLICLEDYEAEEDVRVLNCLHCFHQGCVDRWLSDGANTCPACRKAGVEKEQNLSQPAEALSQATTAAETTTIAQEVPHSM